MADIYLLGRAVPWQLPQSWRWSSYWTVVKDGVEDDAKLLPISRNVKEYKKF